MRGLKPASPLSPDSFAASLAALTGGRLVAGVSLALAVSGGPDSLAMLWLAARAFGARAHVLTFDHGLRPESADEAAMVGRIAAELGLPHAVLRPHTPLPASNIQAEARAARLDAMGAWCAGHGIGWLLTAHHADDQAETLLMRLARGAGLDGLRGIRPMRPLADDVTLLRPLLGWRRADLAAIVAATGWQPADDPTNRDPHYDRTVARNLLADAAWLDAVRIAASAAHLQEAGDALDWATEQAWRSRATRSGNAILLESEALPADLRRRLLLRAFAELGEPAPRGDAVSRLLTVLEAGGRATLGKILAEARDGRWRFASAPPRRG